MKIKKHQSQKNKAGNPIKLEIEIFIGLLIFAIFFYTLSTNVTLTGHVTVESQSQYTDSVGNTYSGNNSFTWSPENSGTISGIRLSGKYSGTGNARVYVSTQDKKILLFTSDNLEETFRELTAYSILDENITLPHTEENTSGNISENTSQPSDNPANPAILTLGYKSGTQFDENDDGIETISGAIDFTVSLSEINENISNSELCTLWDVNSIGSGESTVVCYGSGNCCALFGILPSSTNWNDDFVLTTERYGASQSNNVSAKLVYSPSITLDSNNSDVFMTEWKSLSAIFNAEDYEQKEFRNICADSCSVFLNESNYTIIIEIENSTLEITNITYIIIESKENNAPELIKSIPEINLTQGISSELNLAEYFSDADSDVLQYTTQNSDGLSIIFDGNKAIFTSSRNFTGAIYTYITANDSLSVRFSNIFKVSIFENPDKAVYIVSISNKTVAEIDISGNLKLNGLLFENFQQLEFKENSLIFENSSAIVGYFDNAGNLYLAGNLDENSQLVTSNQNYAIQENSGRTIAYIDSAGNFGIKGSLIEEANLTG